MTKPLRKAIEVLSSNLQDFTNIMELGALQVENQNKIADLRPLFPRAKYTGVDMRAGAGVDVVANGEELPFKDNSFDLIFCLETLEHAKRPWLVATELKRILKKEGILIVSSQQNFPIHLHP